MLHLKRDSGSCCSSAHGMIGVSFKSVNRTFTHSALLFWRRFLGSPCLSSKGSDAVIPRPTMPLSAGPNRIKKNSLPFGRSVRFPHDHRPATNPLRRTRSMVFRRSSQGYFAGFQDNKNAAIECHCTREFPWTALALLGRLREESPAPRPILKANLTSPPKVCKLVKLVSGGSA